MKFNVTFFLLLLSLAIVYCKYKTEIKPNVTEETESIETILKIENDSLLLSKFIALKINEVKEELDLEPGEDYFKCQNIYDGNIVYSSDSILKTITIYGEHSGDATYNPHTKYYIINNNKIMCSGSGKVITLKHTTKKEYTITLNNYSRLKENFNSYRLQLKKDTIILNKTNSN